MLSLKNKVIMPTNKIECQIPEKIIGKFIQNLLSALLTQSMDKHSRKVRLQLSRIVSSGRTAPLAKRYAISGFRKLHVEIYDVDMRKWQHLAETLTNKEEYMKSIFCDDERALPMCN